MMAKRPVKPRRSDVERELHEVIEALNQSLGEADELLDKGNKESKFAISEFEIEISAELNINDGDDSDEYESAGGKRRRKRKSTAMIRLPTRSGPDDKGAMPLSEGSLARIKLKLRRHR